MNCRSCKDVQEDLRINMQQQKLEVPNTRTHSLTHPIPSNSRTLLRSSLPTRSLCIYVSVHAKNPTNKTETIHKMLRISNLNPTSSCTWNCRWDCKDVKKRIWGLFNMQQQKNWKLSTQYKKKKKNTFIDKRSSCSLRHKNKQTNPNANQMGGGDREKLNILQQH
jgi:hypothetical protein